MRNAPHSPFNAEGPLRAGLRSGLCLEGWRWRDADEEAALIVETALRYVGAVRPSWAEAQPSWAQPHYQFTLHTRCLRCGRKIPDARTGGRRGRAHVRHCSNLCANAASDDRARIHGESVSRAEHLARCAARRQSTLEAEIDCPHCGKPFRPGYRVLTRVFCSKPCADAAKPRRQPRLVRQTCVRCGAPLQRGQTKYCSFACYTNRPPGSVRGVERQCPACSAIFRINSATKPQVTCSRRCAWAWRRRGSPTPV